MKTIILTTILIVSTLVQAQIKGIENYRYSTDWDSITLGDKKFVYPDFGPTHREYWYAESATKEGYDKVIAEANRLLNLNGSNLANIESVKDLENGPAEIRSIADIWKEARLYKREFFVDYHLADVHPEVSNHWILAIYLSSESVHLYVANSYVYEFMDHKTVLAQLKICWL